jgi:hypothetical protein
VVFDNAESPAALEPYLPAGNGHVVITSRNPHWDFVARPIEIQEFRRHESVQLVRSRLPLATTRDASRLADAVGDLPTAVDQAAAQLLDTSWSISSYLELLHDRAQTLLDRKDESDGYPLSVAASWQIAFQQLALTNPAALQVVTLAGWLAPEPVLLTLFTDNAHKRRQPSSPTIPNDLLERARQEDAAHRAVHQWPISADSLRRRLGIGTKRSRRLVALVRSEAQTQVTGDPAGLDTVSKGSGAEPALVA